MPIPSTRRPTRKTCVRHPNGCPPACKAEEKVKPLTKTVETEVIDLTFYFVNGSNYSITLQPDDICVGIESEDGIDIVAFPLITVRRANGEELVFVTENLLYVTRKSRIDKREVPYDPLVEARKAQEELLKTKSATDTLQ